MPGFIKPQLATLKTKAPKGDLWLHEIKYDGYRIQVHLSRGRKKVFTRNGLDWTKRFTEIAGALAIPGEAIIDGEVVVVHEGRTNFSELQAELAAGRQGRLIYYAFDLLWRNGDSQSGPADHTGECPLFGGIANADKVAAPRRAPRIAAVLVADYFFFSVLNETPSRFATLRMRSGLRFRTRRRNRGSGALSLRSQIL
jgi:hypothetical protein